MTRMPMDAGGAPPGSPRPEYLARAAAYTAPADAVHAPPYVYLLRERETIPADGHGVADIAARLQPPTFTASIIALILAVAGAALLFVPFIGGLGGFCTVAAVIVAIVALARRRGAGKALALIAIAVCLTGWIAAPIVGAT